MTNASVGQVEMFSAQRLVLRFKNCRVDTRRNYFHPATSFGYWAWPADSGQPEAIRDKLGATIPIRT